MTPSGHASLQVPIPQRRQSGDSAQQSAASSLSSQLSSPSLSASDLVPVGSRSPFAFAVPSPSLHASAAHAGVSSSPFVVPSSVGGSPVAVRLEQLLSQEDALAAAEAADDFQPLPPAGPPLSLSRSSSSHNLMARKREAAAPLLVAQVLPPNQYVQQRIGSILSRGMILKSDQFPSENLRAGLDLHVIGAPNFQQIRPFPLYSAGQPSVSGIRAVLNLLHLKQNPRRTVQWINLREEPVVYLNSRPFVLRELEQPFANMSDFQGIDAARLEGIEERLKSDILAESDNNSAQGNMLVHTEEELGEIRACWCSAHQRNVKTSQQVYQKLRDAEGYKVRYLRIPVTAEGVFEAKQLDALVRCFVDSHSQRDRDGSEVHFVINDQMGRGRSTIGMIAIYLLMNLQAKHTAAAKAAGSAFATASTPPLHPATRDDLAAAGQLDAHDGLSAYRRGEYDIMLRLQRVLRYGKRAKAIVDEAIDRCGRVHHLRNVILESFVASEHARAEDQRHAFSTQTAGYMKRYFMLVCFQAYLSESVEQLAAACAPGQRRSAGELDASHTFAAWWDAHPELQTLVGTLFRDESLLQVVPSAPSTTLPEAQELVISKGSTDGTRASSDEAAKAVVPEVLSPQEVSLSDLCSVLDMAVFRRAGPVLSKRSILKSEFYHFNTRHQRLLKEHGLPNFRFYENLPLAATAQPNVRGIRNILHLLADVSRRRDRRIEAEVEAAEAAEGGSSSSGGAATGAQLDGLRELINTHSNAERGAASTHSTASRLLGHHSSSAASLTRTVSDASDDGSAAVARSNEQLQDAGLVPPYLGHASSMPTIPVLSSSSPVLWINLREEPVVFVNQEPFLVRDYHHPFRVLTEFNTGMTPQRTEQVEERLKIDVLHELEDSAHTHAPSPSAEDMDPAAAAAAAAALHAHQHAPGVKKIVVHEETVSGQIRPRYELVSEPVDTRVQTTAEVFASLRNLGYNLDYARVPLHVEEVPGLRSFDLLFNLLNARALVDEKISVVFSCQKGGRRSTMGMVVCVLMLMHQRSVHYSIRSDVEVAQASAGGVPPPPKPTLLTPEQKLAALNLTLTHHDIDGSAAGSSSSKGAIGELQGLEAGGGQDDANLRGHAVSISAHLRRSKDGPVPVRSSSIGASPAPSPSHAGSGGAEESAPAPSLKKSHSSVAIHIEEVDDRATRARFGRGEFKGILGLIRILKQGGRCKEEVDVAIDAVGGVINIRDSIAEAKTRADSERVRGGPHHHLMGKALKYLESYAYLICFNSYLRELRDIEEEARAAEAAKEQQQQEYKQKVDDEKDEADEPRRVQFAASGGEGGGDSPSQAEALLSPATRAADFPSFSLWIHSRPELRKQLEDIHRDGEDALRLSVAGGQDEQFSGVYESRSGNVLVNGTILKSDYFVGCVNKNIEQVIEGAINFRPIERFPCAGTGIPTVAGIRGILDFYTRPGQKALGTEGAIKPIYQAHTLLWFNLREEPLLYVNEQPFVLRDGDNPYVNIEHTGINTRRLEAMERQLRRDILTESERLRLQEAAGINVHSSSPPPLPEVTGAVSPTTATYRAFLHSEDSTGSLIAVWEDNINKTNIQTPQMQFLRCFEETAAQVTAAAGHSGGAAADADADGVFTARYFRTPITDEQAPSSAALDDIIRDLETARYSPRPVLIFNCQMGRGRTTTGLIIGCLWCIHRGKISDYQSWLNPASGSSKKMLTSASSSPAPAARSLLSQSLAAAATGALTTTTPNSPAVGDAVTTSTSSLYLEPSSIPGDDPQAAQQREEEFANGLRHGWYKIIRQLVRVLPDGPNIKRLVDRVIDHCGTFQNLREVVYETQVMCQTCLPRKKPFFVRRGTTYLVRYFTLILISAYMMQQVADDFAQTYTEWLAERPEYSNILATLQFPEQLDTQRKPMPAARRSTSTILSPMLVASTLNERAALAAGTAAAGASTVAK